jgi:hypothetical protein
VTWPTPSKLALADACAYPWHRLAPAWPEQTTSSDATFGSAFHAAMHVAAVWGGISEAVLEQVAAAHQLTPGDETRLLGCVEHGAELLSLTCPDFRAGEVSILYDVAADTARILPEALERDAIPPGHIHGTLDLVEAWDNGLEIGDWKTGERSAGELAIKTDPQLRTYALLAARAFGRDRVQVALLHASESGIVPDRAELDAFDLACARAALRATLAKVDAGGPPVPGRHCTTKYCPIVASCPATQRALAEVQAAADAQLPMQLTITSPEQAARVRVGLKTVEKALEQYQAELRRYIDEHGAIEIAPGVLYGKVEREGNERVDAEVVGVVTALQELLGDAADEALEVSTSKAAIERAARKAAKDRGLTGKGALKQVTDPVYARLRQLGAIKQGAPQVRYDEILVKKAKGEAA